MSWLEKLKLVESSEGDRELEEFRKVARELSESEENKQVINVQANVKNTSSPEEIYSQNDLSDKTKSIFKVEEIKSVLPETIPNQAKKDSVLGMMKVSNLTLEEVLLDAEQRAAILNGTMEKFTEETIAIVQSCETDIKSLEDKINSLKEKITIRKKSQEDQEKIINDETNKIKSIVEFIK